ncbi:uncharacterized protein LOC135503013 isoform X2 [Lineus longissimus]
MAKGGRVVRKSFTSVRDKNSEKSDEPDNSKKCVTVLKVSAADSDPCLSEEAKVSPQPVSHDVPDIPELSMSDFTIQFENKQPKKQNRRRYDKDQTLCGNEGVSVLSPFSQKADTPELSMSDFTIQFEDEQPIKPKKRRHAKVVSDKTLSRNVGVRVPTSSAQIQNSSNLPELDMSDFTIQFEDEQSKGNKRRREKVCSPKKNRRRSRLSIDIDLANILISPVVDSPDLLLPMPSMRRSSRLRRKSVELYRNCIKSAEIVSDIANHEPKGNNSEPSLLSTAASTASCILSDSESCSFLPKTLESGCSVSSNPRDSPQVHVKCNEEEVPTPDSRKIELSTTMESKVKSVEIVTCNSPGSGRPSCSSVKCTTALESGSDVTETVSLVMEDNVSQGDTSDSLVNYLKSNKPAVQSKECDLKPASKSSTKRPVRTRPQRILLTQSPSTPDAPSPQIKNCRRKSKGKEQKINIEELYRNKNFKMPEVRSWETIYESPGPGQGDLGKKKLKRSLMFEEDPNMHAKYKKRRKRAIKNGWKPLSKAKLEKADKKLLEKLKTFEEELELLKIENSEVEGISTIGSTPTAVANLVGFRCVEKDVLSPAVKSDSVAIGVICKSSESSPLVNPGIDVACLEGDVSVPCDGSTDSNWLEDQRIRNICQTKTNSPEDSEVLPLDGTGSKSPTNDVAPCKSANVESPEAAEVVEKEEKKKESLKDQSYSASTPNSVPNQPSESDTDDDRARTYWEKMNIFQNIFA